MRPHLSALAILLSIASGVSLAKEPPAQVMMWPASGETVLRFSFGKFRETGSSGKQRRYITDVTAENLWSKEIRKADFSLYLFDKDKIRVGEAWISLSDVAVKGIVKFQIAAEASGNPVSMRLSPQLLPHELESFLPPKTISTTVNSVPQGATLKVDGADAGITPKIIEVKPGKHVLTFSKDGFNTGHFPFEIGADSASGGECQL